MSNIEQNLAKILSSQYGRDVRQSIHDGIHNCYEDGKAGSIDLVARELIQQKMSGSPAGTYADLAALIAADPDHSKIYITVDNGNWNYHNGSAWVAGGVYQATAIGDNTVRIPKLSADIQSDLFAFVTQNIAYETGYYAKENGQFYPNPNYLSLKCPCAQYDVFKISTYILGISESPAVIFYDSSFALVSHSSVVNYDLGIIDYLIEIPAGVSYITVTGHAQKAIKPLIKKLQSSIAAPRPLAGKTILTMGDSITYGAVSTNHYQDKIAEITGAYVINSGYSGSKYAMMLNHEPWNSHSFYQKTIDLDLSAIDYIWIMYGVNDFNGGVPLGTASSDEFTVCGALYKGLSNLMLRVPSVKILASTPIFFCTYDGTTLSDPDTEVGDYSGVYMRDYIAAIKSIYALFRVPVYDAFAECRINIKNHATYLADMLHPNNAGNNLIGEQFAKFILLHS